MSYLIVTCVALSLSWTLLSIVALWRRRRAASLRDHEPVTVLKPLRGADENLEANLRACFEQDYDNFDIVFGIEGQDDLALPIVERLRAQYAHVASRVVIHEGGTALNPKVRNVIAMLSAGAHDVVVISDANIRVEPHYVRRSLALLQQANTGLVTHPIAGVGNDTLGSTLECAYLNTHVVAGIVTATHVFKQASVIGKSMMFRRSVLEALGGLDSLSNVLAEDYVMGRMFQHAGMQVVLSDDAVINTCAGSSLPTFIERAVRWSMIRSRVQPLAYMLEPLSSPLVILACAPWMSGPISLWIALSAAMLITRDVSASARLGLPMSLRQLLLGPARELLWLYAWCEALGHKHVAWRGHRLRVSAGTRLYRVGEARGVGLGGR